MSDTEFIIYLDMSSNNPLASPGKGPLSSLRILVGPAPSERGQQSSDPRARNQPMGPKSLAVLDKLSEGYQGVYITNLKKEPHPFKKKVGIKDVRTWAPLLYHELSLVVVPGKSRILAMGVEAAMLLCPGFQNMKDDHGAVFYNPQLDCEVIPTMTFQAGMSDPKKRSVISSDVKRFFHGEFEKLQEFVLSSPREALTPEVYLDIETTGLDLFTDEIHMVGLLCSDKKSPAYIAQKPSPKTFEKLFSLLKDKTVIGHNIAFDLSFLEAFSGLPWTTLKCRDTMLSAYLLGETQLGLKHLTSLYTQRRGSHAGGSFEDPQYLAEDLASTRELDQFFGKRASSQWISQMLYSLAPRIARMRLYGVHLDWDLANKLARDYQKKIAVAKKKLDKDFPNINWNSGDQVSDAFLKAGIPLTEKTPTGKFSVSEPTLAAFRGQYPVLDSYFEHKDLEHNLSFLVSYAELKGPDKRLHPKFNLTSTATGRSSMNDPNLQQVPRVGPIKCSFRSRFDGGYFGLIDLDQAELRIAAMIADDELLAQTILSEDVHRELAAVYFDKPAEEVSAKERKASKPITFGLLYGGSTKGLSERSGLPEAQVAKGVSLFYKRFTKLNEFIETQKYLAVETGQSSTPLGRIRSLKDLIDEEGERSAERKGINTPIQGTASDVMLVIINSVFRQIEKAKLQSGVIFGVHDSSAHDVHPKELDPYVAIVRQAFRELGDTPLGDFRLWKHLPLTGEFIIGDTWASVESTNEEFYNPIAKYECSSLE